MQSGDSGDIWHTLIGADNHHALQILEYIYPKQMDCIYIDPPYNTGVRDWKYNNDYVDFSDAYHVMSVLQGGGHMNELLEARYDQFYTPSELA